MWSFNRTAAERSDPSLDVSNTPRKLLLNNRADIFLLYLDERMSKRLKGVLQYDGTGYRGWQRQADALTVQEVCERSLEKIFGERVSVVASGRTDTGVHARGQVVHFEHETTIGNPELKRAWNAQLPNDVWVERLTTASADFHARHDAVTRTYRYFVADGRLAHSPFVCRYSWALDRRPDWDAINAVTSSIVGAHDFRHFAKGVSEGQCSVHSAEWHRTRNGSALEITANRFLRHMVRALVGALISIGRGQVKPTSLSRALQPRGEPVAAAHAPPQGLFLWKVKYAR